MSETKKIIILGAGYGGILTAKKLIRKFKKDTNISITLIDKNSYHTMLTELHEVAAGRVPEEAIRVNLEKVFAGRKIEVILDEIENIDFDKQVLTGQVGSYTYDYLVLGTGSKPTFYNCHGAKEHALTLWSYEDAIRIKNHILKIMGDASIEKDPVKRKNLLTFMVIGCGFTGIEMAGELAEWKERLCKTFTIDPKEVKIYLVDMVPKVLPMFKDSLINKTEKRLKKMDIEVLTSSNITEVKKDFVTIEGKGTIETHTVIWAAGVEGSTIADKLDLEKTGRNRVQTDQYLRAKGKENVFVVGDNIFYIPEGESRPVPQMVENAEHSASLVSKNVVATVKKQALEPYKPSFHGAMVCIGGRYGVAQVGTKSKEFVFSGFIAMFIKHFVNMIYFFQVAGFNKIWSYLMHEIFHVEDNRSFVGGLFAKRSPNFWLVPLRVFIGLKWLLEGLDKLPKILNDPNTIFLIPMSQKMVDATSAASEAVEAVPYTLPLPDFMLTVIDWLMGVFTNKGVDAASLTALPVPGFVTTIMDAMMNTFFYKADGSFTFLATVFQTGMVCAEIIVGLCLIAGLFTALISAVSIVMGLMIWSSGMAPTEMLWYMAGGFATIGGSGSTFGLDYFVLPFLKKRWKKLKFVKKWYLFTD